MNGAALKLTVGKYLTPNFTDIQSVGIAPDILLAQSQVSEDEIILFNESKHFREKDLKKHLDEHSKAELPYEKIKYLSFTDPDSDSETEEQNKNKKTKITIKYQTWRKIHMCNSLKELSLIPLLTIITTISWAN
jgi:carboxyl-terminal processing protease